MILDKHDRLRFAEYCRVQSESCEAIAGQLAKLGPAMDVMAKRERSKSAAFQIVSMELSADREEVSMGKAVKE